MINEIIKQHIKIDVDLRINRFALKGTEKQFE